ncbi:MAG TPA: hypothetical protein DHW78_05170 [Ruminococcaceae bacterium]|nr:hypothetical protein [Oscillospiraceae bacterium]HCM23698.1 hypothetical protein [Oscillospiraceae bacterium]
MFGVSIISFPVLTTKGYGYAQTVQQGDFLVGAFRHLHMAEKKIIVSQLIRQVRIWKDYRIEIDFSVNIEQLLNYQQPPLSA